MEEPSSLPSALIASLSRQRASQGGGVCSAPVPTQRANKADIILWQKEILCATRPDSANAQFAPRDLAYTCNGIYKILMKPGPVGTGEVRHKDTQHISPAYFFLLPPLRSEIHLLLLLSSRNREMLVQPSVSDQHHRLPSNCFTPHCSHKPNRAQDTQWIPT